MISATKLLEALERAGLASAAVDLGETKVLMLETDDHVSDETIAGGRLRTLVILGGAPAVLPDSELLTWRALGVALEALVTTWRRRAGNSGSSPYRRMADELETILHSMPGKGSRS